MRGGSLPLRNAFLLLFAFQVVFAFCAGTRNVAAEETQGAVFCTWEVFETDKCASIWLIKRFIDKKATIRIVPKGDPTEGCIPFDTPDAKFRRYHNMSTFESLLSHYKLKDPKLVYMGKIIHDVEVNAWERKLYDETHKVQDAVSNILQTSENSAKIMDEGCKYFDWFYDHVASEKLLESQR